MKPRIAKRLVEVLKSGNFKKGKFKLAKIVDNKYQFCCLGVLCELYNYEQKLNHKKQLEFKLHKKSNSEEDTYASYDDKFGTTPDKVKKWAEISESEQDDLINLNDHNPTWYKVIDYLNNLVK
mgnify:CR=1 FL=1